MINDPIPSGQAQQLLYGVVVSATSDGSGNFHFTFLNHTGHFRAIGPYTAVGSTIEVGEHWHIDGEWNLHEEIGDYFKILSAELTFPEINTFPIWLQYNVLGMGSWYAMQLCQLFKEELPTLLQNSEFERLLSAKSEARRMNPRLLLDACAAWKKYHSQVIITNSHVPTRVRRYALQAHSFFGNKLSEVLQYDLYRLAYFSGSDAVDALQPTGCPTEGEIKGRALAIVDLLVSRRFQAGETLIPRVDLTKEIGTYYGESDQLGQLAINYAISSGRLRVYDGKYVQGEGVSQLVKKVAYLMSQIGWSGSEIHYSETLADITGFFSNDVERNHAWVMNLGCVFPSPVDKLISLLRSHINSIQFVSIHAEQLRADHSLYRAHFSHPDEIIQSQDTSYQNRRSLVFLDLHAWSLCSLLEVLQRISPGHSCIFCGVEFGDFPVQSLWGDLIKVTQQTSTSIPPTSPAIVDGSNLLSALCNGVTTKVIRYKKDEFQSISCVDVPDDQLLHAVVGVAFQLLKNHDSVQVLTTEMDLLPALNVRMQISFQELNDARQAYLGAIKLCVGDRVVQTAAWADSLPIHRVGIVTEIFDPPLIFRGACGYLKRYRVRVNCNGVFYDLSHAEATSLQLAHALAYNTSVHSYAAATIIVSRSFNQLDVACLIRALNIASARVVFVGAGSSAIRTVNLTSDLYSNPSAFINELRAHHHEISH